jgi:hypothetical protein
LKVTKEMEGGMVALQRFDAVASLSGALNE